MVLRNEPILELELPDDFDGLRVGILNRTGYGDFLVMQRKPVYQENGWLVVIELVNPPEDKSSFTS